MLQLPFFHMLAEGPFATLSTTLVSGHLKRSTESHAFIECMRQRRRESGVKECPSDHKSSRFHYVGSARPWWRPHHLALTLEPCVSYNDHAGAVSQEYLERFGWDFLPNAVAVSGLVESEGKILITQRKKADYKKDGLHFSMGGFISVDKDPGGHPVAALCRELKEEVGIETNEIEKLVCLGIAWDPWQNKPDVLFRVKTKTSGTI